MIVCGECYDKGAEAGKWMRFLAIVTHRICELCGRSCLGYVVRSNPAEIVKVEIS